MPVVPPGFAASAVPGDHVAAPPLTTVVGETTAGADRDGQELAGGRGRGSSGRTGRKRSRGRARTAAGWIRSPGHRKSSDAVHEAVRPHLDLVRGSAQTQHRQPLEERGNRDAQFDTGQLLADALMDAEAEGQVSGGVAATDVEGVGVLEALRVTVGREQGGDHHIALSDLPAADLDVLSSRPRSGPSPCDVPRARRDGRTGRSHNVGWSSTALIPRRQARELTDQLLPDRKWSSSLLKGLFDEGVLTRIRRSDQDYSDRPKALARQ